MSQKTAWLPRSLSVEFQPHNQNANRHAVLFVREKKFGRLIEEINEDTGGLLHRAIEVEKFTGKPGEAFTLIAPAKSWDKLIVMGVGAKAVHEDVVEAGGKAWKMIGRPDMRSFGFMMDSTLSATHAAYAAEGAALAAGTIDGYKTGRFHQPQGVVVYHDGSAPKNLWESLRAEVDGVRIARGLTTAPANIITPATFAEACSNFLSGLEVNRIGMARMLDLGMGGLLAVGQGSPRDPELVVMKWNGAENPRERPIVFIGKGITFDTGGNNLKTTAGMDKMHYDKAGAATVTGIMRALAGRGAAVNAVGIVALAENKIGPLAIEPNSIIHMMNGKTVEITNTDCEGRLVLADAMTYAQRFHKPALMIDFATLTGAITTALGGKYAGMFTRNAGLAMAIQEAGEQVHERVWPLPVDFADKLGGNLTDHVNWKSGGAGASVAAAFLDLFVENRGKTRIPHVHLDVAETAWESPGSATCPKGIATGWGVRLANRLVSNNFER